MSEVDARWRSADLDMFPDYADSGIRYEIIDGELHVSKQPAWHHQHACIRLAYFLEDWNMRTGLGVTNAAPGIIFADDDDVAPDVVWISRARLATALQADEKLHAAPELVIEVLSPGSANERRDREAKRALYARRGVDEYWIVDWQQRRVDVFRRAQDALALVATLAADDTLETPLLPGFRCAVWRLFDD
jgi:Uma2 family endonuclease